MSYDSRYYYKFVFIFIIKLIFLVKNMKITIKYFFFFFTNLPEFVRKYHCLVEDKNTVALRGPSRSLKKLGLEWAWRAHPLVSLDLCRRSNPRSRHHSLKQRESKFLYQVHFPRLLSYTFNKIFFFQISNSVMKYLMINWWKSLNL